MEKVKITQEQAKSFETFRNDQYTNQMIVEMVTGNANGYVVITLRELAKNHYDKFLQALVIGYEVEETPEDKLKAHWNELLNNLGECHPANSQKVYLDGQMRGMSKVLDLLGIKIEGIN